MADIPISTDISFCIYLYISLSLYIGINMFSIGMILTLN